MATLCLQSKHCTLCISLFKGSRVPLMGKCVYGIISSPAVTSLPEMEGDTLHCCVPVLLRLPRRSSWRGKVQFPYSRGTAMTFLLAMAKTGAIKR